MAQPLAELLARANVQQTFIDKLIEDGWTTELFAVAASSIDQFDQVLPEILRHLDRTLTPIQRAGFRLAWTRCQAPSSPEPASSKPTPDPLEASAVSGSWSEAFAPKLNSSVVAELKAKFKKNYPAEILVAENTPSLRLLSLVYHQKTKQEFKWVPWKFRLSQARSDDISSKSSKVPKAESLQLHALIMDNPPEISLKMGLWACIRCVSFLRLIALHWLR